MEDAAQYEATPQEPDQPVASTSGSKPALVLPRRTGTVLSFEDDKDAGSSRSTGKKARKRQKTQHSRSQSQSQSGSVQSTSRPPSEIEFLGTSDGADTGKGKASTSRSAATAETSKELRRAHKAHFFAQLVARDRENMTDEEFASPHATEARHNEASRQANVANLAGVKKQKIREERRGYRIQLREAGLEARSSSPETAAAAAPPAQQRWKDTQPQEQDGGQPPALNKKGKPMSKRAEHFSIFQKQLAFFQNSLDREAKRSLSRSEFETSAPGRQEEAKRLATIVNQEPHTRRGGLDPERDKLIAQLKEAGIRLYVPPESEASEQDRASEIAAAQLRDDLDAGYENSPAASEGERGEAAPTLTKAERKRKKKERKAAERAGRASASTSTANNVYSGLQEEDKEEGELGLGDLFFVDTAPAALPEELQRTREAQQGAEQEAKEEGVPLDLHLREEVDTLPDYVDIAPPTPQSLPAARNGGSRDSSDRKGKARAVQDYAGSDSGSTSPAGPEEDEPDDLAINVQSAVTTDTEMSGVADIDADAAAQAEAEADMSMRTTNRYFKEENPELQCARCGEQGHNVKTCQHIIVRQFRLITVSKTDVQTNSASMLCSVFDLWKA